MTWRHAVRDYFRRRRVRAHVARQGTRFQYHGLEVLVPDLPGGEAVALGPRNALLRGKYETSEAAMITKHLPADLPVIELGGSLGVVSRLIRSRIGPERKHVIVEANADLIAACTANANLDAAPGAAEVVNAAVWHDGPVARLGLGPDIHSNAVGAGAGSRGGVRDVPAVTLATLLEKIGRPARYALVSDIEGGEYGVFEHESDALRGAAVVILEIHPPRYDAMGKSEAAFMALAAKAGLKPVERIDDVVVFVRA